MPPRDNLAPSSLGFKYPANRDHAKKSGDLWLEDKRNDDNAEGLWRVHDELYDVTDFVDKHPGGKMWLELTKGTDITEAFEVHHLSVKAENILKKFHVRKAEAPRHPPYTFKEDGFYKTLKRNVRQELDKLPKSPVYRSILIADGFLLSTFILGILSCYYKSYTIAVMSGVMLCYTTIVGHNYFHQKDNFRMYYFDLSMMSSREWRISHALSHHLLTNSIYDLEISLFEPFLEYLPTPKTFFKKYSSWIAAPITWLTLFHISMIRRLAPVYTNKNLSSLSTADLIPLLLPIAMYIFGGRCLIGTFITWNVIVFVGSFIFGLIGLNAAHHHPDIFHDGDAVREDKDWGISQLDTVMDRHELKGSHLLVITHFGDHALHHMFPTLDHGLLQHLYPVFEKTCKEFKINLRMTTQLNLVKGQFKQLLRMEPNKDVPDLFKYK